MNIRQQKSKKICIFLLIMYICIFQIQGVDVYAMQGDGIQSEVLELDLGDYQSEMKVGEKQLLSVTPLPEDAVYTEITYASSNPAVAKINGMGRIIALEPGTTEICVSCGMVTEKFLLSVVSSQNEVVDLDLGDYPSEIEISTSQMLNVMLYIKRTM